MNFLAMLVEGDYRSRPCRRGFGRVHPADIPIGPAVNHVEAAMRAAFEQQRRQIAEIEPHHRFAHGQGFDRCGHFGNDHGIVAGFFFAVMPIALRTKLLARMLRPIGRIVIVAFQLILVATQPLAMRVAA